MKLGNVLPSLHVYQTQVHNAKRRLPNILLFNITYLHYLEEKIISDK